MKTKSQKKQNPKSQIHETDVKKESVIIFEPWYRYLRALDNYPVVMSAIFDYAFYGKPVEDNKELTDLDRLMLTCNILPCIDRNVKRYENACKGGQYGSRGGRGHKKKPLKGTDEQTLNDDVNANANVNAFANEKENKNDDVDDDATSEKCAPGLPSNPIAGRKKIMQGENCLAPGLSSDQIPGMGKNIGTKQDDAPRCPAKKNHVQGSLVDDYYYVFFFRNIRDYVGEAKRFFNYYESNDWRVKSTGTKLDTYHQRVFKAEEWECKNPERICSPQCMEFWHELFMMVKDPVASLMVDRNISLTVKQHTLIISAPVPVSNWIYEHILTAKIEEIARKHIKDASLVVKFNKPL